MRVSEFLSTPSARRATRRWLGRGSGTDYFYPRPPRGGRLCYLMDGRWTTLISIHALREEGDSGTVANYSKTKAISIHALREEGDLAGLEVTSFERQFLSTPSARRATLCALDQLADQRISIHALREEGDAMVPMISMTLGNFYPRPPRGGRRPWLIRFTMQSYFYPRPPRGGRRGIKGGIAKGGVFLSTPSARRATPVMLATPDRSTISIHALREEGDVRL